MRYAEESACKGTNNYSKKQTMQAECEKKASENMQYFCFVIPMCQSRLTFVILRRFSPPATLPHLPLCILAIRCLEYIKKQQKIAFCKWLFL